MTAATPTLLPSLLEGAGPDLAEHLARFGPLPAADAGDLAGRSALTGRGGAAFPTLTKLRSVAEAAARTGRAPVVVANGAEGEPAADKDRTLLRRSPHLVLDGLALVAATLGAPTTVLAADATVLPGIAQALAQRAGGSAVRWHPVAASFVAGEESALVSALDGGPPRPRTKIPPVRERGVGGRPTLVLNVETLARLAMIARGDGDAAQHLLVTRHAPVAGIRRSHVVDVALGTPLADLLPLADDRAAVLIGGYSGTWLPADVARSRTLDLDSLAAVGASPGAGVLAVLPADRCGLRETAAVVALLARDSAGQCGPCLNGLPRIAAALTTLAAPQAPPPAVMDDVTRWCGLVVGRGACSHPDGTVRLVASALTVFAGELAAHARGWCSASHARPFLPGTGVPQ